MHQKPTIDRKKIAFNLKTSAIVTYIIVDFLYIFTIHHILLNRSMVFYAIKLICFAINIIYIFKITDKWIKGEQLHYARSLIGAMFLTLIIGSYVDLFLEFLSRNNNINNIITTSYIILAYAFLLVLILNIFIENYAKKLSIEERTIVFYIPIYEKFISVTFFIVFTITSILIYRGVSLEHRAIIDISEEKFKKEIASMNTDALIYFISLENSINKNSNLISSIYEKYGYISQSILENEFYNNIAKYDINGASPFKEIYLSVNNNYTEAKTPLYMKLDSDLNGKSEVEYSRQNNIRDRINKGEYKKLFEFSKVLVKLNIDENTKNTPFDIVLKYDIIIKNENIATIEMVATGNHLRNILTRSYSQSYWKYLFYNMENGIVYDGNDEIALLNSYIYMDDIQNMVDEVEKYYIDNPKNTFFIESKTTSIEENKDTIIFTMVIPQMNTIAIYMLPTSSIINFSTLSENTALVLGGILLLIIVSGLILNFIIKHIISPLKLASNSANALKAGAGDLRQRIAVSSNDEIGILIYNFNDFILGLDSLITKLKNESKNLTNKVDTMNNVVDHSNIRVDEQIGRITKTVAVVNNIFKSINNLTKTTDQQRHAFSSASVAINDLLETIFKINENMERQSAAVEQTSVSIEEMISNIGSVSKSINYADNYSQKLLQDARYGGYKVDEVIEAMREVDESRGRITEIITVIQNVAEQTNLLAMNAAIEAAHAGKQGKGFAVVADEIRILAETTASNTKSIKVIIKDITKRIGKAVELTMESGKSLENILDTSKNTARVISEINIANTELEIGGHDILETVKHLNAITYYVKENSKEQMTNGDIVDTQIDILNNIIKEVGNSIEESTLSAKDIVESMTFLTNIAESSKKENNELHSVIDSLHDSFILFNALFDSFITEADITQNPEESKNQENSNNFEIDSLNESNFEKDIIIEILESNINEIEDIKEKIKDNIIKQP